MVAKEFRMMVPAAIALLAVIIAVGVGSIVLGEFQGQRTNTIDQLTTTDEYDQPTATSGINPAQGFQQYTLNNKGPEDLASVDTVKFSDVSAGTNTTLTEGNNYTVDLTAATNQVNVTQVSAYNSSAGDAFFTTYTNQTRNAAYEVLGQGLLSLNTFADFFAVIVIMIVAGLVFMALSVVRGSRRRASA